MYFCAGKCSTAEACMLLDQQGGLVRCDADSELLAATDADPALELASEVLTSKGDISGRAEMRASTEKFKIERVTLLSRKMTSVREILPRRYDTQVLASRSQRFICNKFKDYFLSET